MGCGRPEVYRQYQCSPNSPGNISMILATKPMAIYWLILNTFLAHTLCLVFNFVSAEREIIIIKKQLVNKFVETYSTEQTLYAACYPTGVMNIFPASFINGYLL